MEILKQEEHIKPGPDFASLIEIHHQPPFPLLTSASSSPIPIPQMFALVEAIGKVLDGKRRIMSAFLTKQEVFEMVFSLDFDDGSSGTARVAYNFETDPDALEWIKRKFASEVASLRYLRELIPSVPLPRVFHTDFSTTNPLGGPYILIDKCSGEPISMLIQNMDSAEREAMVKAIAEAAAQMFHVTLPRIGSVLSVEGSKPTVGPLARHYSPARIESPVDGIQQYIAGEILYHSQLAESDDSSEYENNIKPLLTRMEKLSTRLAPTTDDKSMQRVALVFTDWTDRRILVEEDGELTGIHGEEQASGIPACMAATYPSFLRRDGIYSLKYRPDTLDPEGALLEDGEAAHLRDVFSAAARKIDPSFAVALKKGEKIRQMFEFIQYSAWDQLRLWESDVRAELGLPSA